jgi:mono/diheme cytochrome c family protein
MKTTGIYRHSFFWAVALAVVSFGCGKKSTSASLSPTATSYDVEQDWNDAQHLIPLNYEQAEGKRVFYTYCVWCHADSTPAGPSNRSNLAPVPALGDDGTVLNAMSDDLLRNMITLGGSAMGKSAMMPPWGKTLTQRQIHAVITYMRAIASPAYTPPARPGPQYNVK